mmetsp:Transcript_71228/g.148652  ORF Transcript_71228/g.148652 Transcript_71228/m.148652 type:complete len:219 (-) Transcript_71228:317-973(-)
MKPFPKANPGTKLGSPSSATPSVAVLSLEAPELMRVICCVVGEAGGWASCAPPSASASGWRCWSLRRPWCLDWMRPAVGKRTGVYDSGSETCMPWTTREEVRGTRESITGILDSASTSAGSEQRVCHTWAYMSRSTRMVTMARCRERWRRKRRTHPATIAKKKAPWSVRRLGLGSRKKSSTAAVKKHVVQNRVIASMNKLSFWISEYTNIAPAENERY